MKIYGNENNVFLLKEIGIRIHNLRINMNLSQEELATLSGVGLRTISRIENGENTNLSNLLNVLRVIKMIPNLDLLIPEQDFVPTDYVDYGKKRERISRKNKDIETDEWKWGEDK